ncbi:MAG: glycosyl hydrolase 115 family protein [Bacteroidota bacterium]|nr:glycosyl hydrolase 115 family protein [Bacteroidota bacterium]
MNRILSSFILANLLAPSLHAQDFVTSLDPGKGFPVASAAGATAILVGDEDHWLERKAAEYLQQDVERVTGRKPEILHSMPASAMNLIIIGSLDSSMLVRRLADERRLSVMDIRGKWEAYCIQVLDHPAKGIGRAMVICGSDRRGTAYGVLELSRQMGVSPWYWWADVPVRAKTAVYVKNGVWSHGPPAVKYRGIFINDEAPAFSGWAKEKFGGANHHVYEKVFELLLRLKGNYLWPAMWGNAFNDDDPMDPVLADQYGIVMGTSHHEPMLRAQQEWKRYGSGPWNYETNRDTLQAFWRRGIEHMGNHESIVTVGMRGDGDKPMTEGSNVELLERIVRDQRELIAQVTGKPPSATPQLWALYKEVQDYYDKGMRAPDDVTLLLCDDNWGNIRRLPKAGEKPRGGGYGIYYHFDYVGGPRNYKWLNTNPIARTWEQMHLALEHGVDRIWIVNVGDIKPMEYPISFFLDYAWDPARWPAKKLPDYARQWAAEQFGPGHAADIADLLTNYTKFNGRRKPELLSPDTYSLQNYREADTVEENYNRLTFEAAKIKRALPVVYHDAWFELVQYPIEACANLNSLYVTVARNRLAFAQGRVSTNAIARLARTLYARDSALSSAYNHVIAGGKWDHMMDQTHIGYTYWQEPRLNRMPEVKTFDSVQANATPIDGAGRDTISWGVAVEGSAAWWPKAADSARAVLPVFDLYGEPSHYIDIFARRNEVFSYKVKAAVPWLHFRGKYEQPMYEQRLLVTVDWARAPAGRHEEPITVTGPGGQTWTVMAVVNKPEVRIRIASPAIAGRPGARQPETAGVAGDPNALFVEGDGVVSMEAEHYNHAVGNKEISWLRIPDLGRTGSGMEAAPVTAATQTPGGNSPHLEYRFYSFDTGQVKVHAYFSPTLDIAGTGKLLCAISLDDEEPQILNLSENSLKRGVWDKWVSDNIIIKTSEHHIMQAGVHTLKYWMVDPAVVLQKFVVDEGGERPSYLGPPESLRGYAQRPK